MSYKDAVEHIELCRHIKKQGWSMNTALHLLAEPLKDDYNKLKDA